MSIHTTDNTFRETSHAGLPGKNGDVKDWNILFKGNYNRDSFEELIKKLNAERPAEVNSYFLRDFWNNDYNARFFISDRLAARIQESLASIKS